MREVLITTAGLGDLIAWDSFLTKDEKQGLEVIHWATSARAMAQPLFDLCKEDYPNLTHVVEWDDWDDRPFFFSKAHLEQLTGKKVAKNVAEWNPCDHLDDLKKRPFRESSFLKIDVPVDHLNLPEHFIAVQATTPKNGPSMRNLRDFKQQDWNELIRLVRQRKTHAVLLNSESDPEHNVYPVLDRGGMTTVAEAICVLKRAQGFVGIDSWTCILAAKHFTKDQIQIRARNQQFYNYGGVYLAPHVDFRFVRESISADFVADDDT